jgi:predicted DCC family thiol-disulfide oxidoreductase YuxK
VVAVQGTPKPELGQDERRLLVYDGACALCKCSVRLLGRVVKRPYRSVPWQQGDLASLGLSPEQCQLAVQWVGPDGERAQGPAAVASLLRTAGGPLARAVGGLLARPAVARAAERIYNVVAANRHLLAPRSSRHEPACSTARSIGEGP